MCLCRLICSKALNVYYHNLAIFMEYYTKTSNMCLLVLDNIISIRPRIRILQFSKFYDNEGMLVLT